MITAQNTKVVPIAFSEAITDDDSITTASVDLKGWDYAQVFVYVGTTDIALTALKIQQSDDDASSDAYADVTGLVFGTSDNIAGSTSTLPSATDDDSFFIFDIDARKTERYIDLVATVGNGSAGGWVHAFAILSRGEDSPVTAAERGASQVLRV